MTKLDEYRKLIDEIDSNIKELFIKRMEVVSKVIEYKKENNLDVYDSKREQDMFNKLVIEEEYKEYYIRLYKTLIELSKEYQRNKL